jgi:uncharacterized protein (DUF362 family)
MNHNCVAIENAYDYNPLSVNKAMDALCDDLGMPTDNPFSSFIQPGMKVFIKPNWVASRWRESADHRDTLYSVITHEAVIEAVADRVVRALQGKGELVIGDNPSIDADFEELMRFNGIRRLEQKYNVKTTVIDMRPLVCTDLKYYNQKDKMEQQSGDPLGEVQVNLGNDSLLSEVDSSLFQGVFNEREETVAAHTGDTQLYTYGRSLYDADVYISIPKLKTHQKVGATLNLKGLVGSITRKNQLVHWRVGSPETGGDEYPNADSLEASKHAKVTHRGAWPGNDTIWRMVVDLYKGMLLKPERKYFTVVDGIIGGEGQGPFCPHAKRSNVLLAGSDLLITDIVSARLMGLDPMKVHYLEYFIETGMAFLDKIIIKSSNPQYGADFFNTNDRYLDFQLVDKWNCVKV